MMFNNVDLSVSSYDTAWVAMVPSPNSLKDPFFPECLNWLLGNQHHDGSWGPHNFHPLLKKDALLSTLACILALNRWSVGQEQINKGLHFIESNLASATDEEQQSPVGFDIIFPSMIESAMNLDMNLPLRGSTLDTIFQRRDFELQRGYGSNSEGWRAFLAYTSEGNGKFQDWETAMKYQRKNGSLFNSPSTTAAAFTHLKNPSCLTYLRTLLEKFGNADNYARLTMVSSLESLGIDRHFRAEITGVLDETYRFWLQGDDDIFSDAATCATAFRLLRVNGYDVSADPLTQFSEDCFFNSLGGYLRDVGAALELFRASEITLHPDESVLEKLNYWTRRFLKQELSSNLIQAHRLHKHIGQEVDHALKCPYHAKLGRLSIRKVIKHYNADSTRILKSSYSSLNIGNEDFLKLAVEDYNFCQSIHHGEFNHFARWVVEQRLDKLKFARQKQPYCYFSAATSLFPPELSDARMSWAKSAFLTTVVDDFFDIGGSEEELVNLIQLVEKWDVNASVDCCSEHVQIIFSAVRSIISEIGVEAFKWQGRSVTNHVTEIWLECLKSMLKEAGWSRNKLEPTMEEYMANAYVSLALGPIVLPALYFVGPKLSEDVLGNSELQRLFMLMSTCGRLLNDIQSCKRELEQGKLNSVSLAVIHGGGIVTEEDAINEIKSVINRKTKELLRLVVLKKGSIVPRECKNLFWNMNKVIHLFYWKDDGLSGNEMMKDVNEVIDELLV
ncbi:hypothetical protein L3X38_024274 [Prunus dulcis]|uniref:ent-kaurene synthase n=2 Tax=Prunus dulcis TaxID=3755 RepID=A0AAD4W214_PRUDU|nr:hypothetical protein L3X38_024274 [Prunus dulcis]